MTVFKYSMGPSFLAIFAVFKVYKSRTSFTISPSEIDLSHMKHKSLIAPEIVFAEKQFSTEECTCYRKYCFDKETGHNKETSVPTFYK